jgi:hypothetical protein
MMNTPVTSHPELARHGVALRSLGIVGPKQEFGFTHPKAVIQGKAINIWE